MMSPLFRIFLTALAVIVAAVVVLAVSGCGPSAPDYEELGRQEKVCRDAGLVPIDRTLAGDLVCRVQRSEK